MHSFIQLACLEHPQCGAHRRNSHEGPGLTLSECTESSDVIGHKKAIIREGLFILRNVLPSQKHMIHTNSESFLYLIYFCLERKVNKAKILESTAN